MVKLATGLVIFGMFSATVMAAQEDVNKALKQHNIKGALQAFSQLSGDEQSSLKGQILQARLYFAQDKTEQAYDLLEPLLKQHGDLVELQFRFGQSAVVMAQKASIFSKLGYAKEGRKAWEKAVKLDSTYLPALDAIIGFHTGAPSIAGGDKDKALQYIKTLKQLNPELAYGKLISLHRAMEKPELASSSLAQGLKEFPSSSELLFVQGMLHIDNEQWSAVHQSFKAAMIHATTDEQRQRILYQSGKASAKSGVEVDAGVKALEQLLAMPYPYKLNWAKYRLAQLYVHDGKIAQAKALMSQIDDENNDELEDRLTSLKRKIKKLS